MAQSTDKKPRHCLVVDDEADICQAIAFALEPQGWQVRSCLDFGEGEKAIEEEYFDLALIDLRLGDKSGLDLLPQLQKSQAGIPVIIITAYASIPSAVEAVRRGAMDYLPKPFNPQELRSAVAHAQASGTMRKRQDDLEGQAVLSSRLPAVQAIFDQAEKIASSNVSLLLLGETGTGKGVLAKAIHDRSARKEGPFVVVACPAMPEGLLESELFGYERGAFTGAYRDHKGRLARAQDGTLFLDEVGDMPMALQAKLLRLLQTREYERLGGSETFHANARIIAATHVNLTEAVKDGRFREDLYYRLSGLELTLPPLRERLDDLEELANHMLRDLREELGQGPSRLSQEVLALFKERAWPGNLRELHNLLERACVLGKHTEVRPEDLSAGPASQMPPAAEAQAEPQMAASQALESMEEVEVAHIRKVLASTRSFDEAARVLGMDGVTLWRRRKKYKL